MPSNINITGVTTTQSGTGAVVRPIQAKLNDLYNLSDYGGNCDGSADNTTPFTNAIAAIVANGGGHLIIPAGTCMSSTINLPEGVPFWMQGQGVDATTIKLTSGANADLVTNPNFAALSATGAAGGIFRIELSDMTLDGNMANQTGTSWVLRTYGHGNRWEDLIVQHGLTGGIYSSYGTAIDIFASPANDLEDSYVNIKTIFNGVVQTLSTVTFNFSASYGAGYAHSITIAGVQYPYGGYLQTASDTDSSIAQTVAGYVIDRNATASVSGASLTLTALNNSGATITVSASDGNTSGSLVENQSGDGFLFRGPHDSVVQNLISYGNSGWGFHNQTNLPYYDGSLDINGLNTYMNTLGGVYNEDAMSCAGECAFTTATGWGHFIASYSGLVKVTSGTWAAMNTHSVGPALECRNALNDFNGMVANTSVDGSS